MGGAQSTATRKITIPNEDNLVKVSDSVAERLKKCQEPEKPELKKEACDPDDFQTKVSSNQVSSIPGDTSAVNLYGPSLTSLRLLQEKEKELRESERYWSQRIQNLEDHHSNLSRIMEQEYEKSMKEISCQVPRKPPNTPQPCIEKRQMLLDCYKRHPDEALLCAEEVSDFAKCVHTKRISSSVLASECVK